MSQYENNLTGVLFINDKKLNDKHPDRKGTCEIDGVEYWISAWDRQTKRGDTISLRFEQKKKAVEAYQAAARPSAPQQNDPDFEDDVPW